MVAMAAQECGPLHSVQTYLHITSDCAASCDENCGENCLLADPWHSYQWLPLHSAQSRRQYISRHINFNQWMWGAYVGYVCVAPIWLPRRPNLHLQFHLSSPRSCVGTKRAWYLFVPTAVLFPGIFETYLCHVPLLRNSAVIATHKIAVKVGVAIMGEPDLPLEDIDR